MHFKMDKSNVAKRIVSKQMHFKTNQKYDPNGALGKNKFCLGLQIEHLLARIFVHQSSYTEKILKYFNMDKAHPLSTPMVL